MIDLEDFRRQWLANAGNGLDGLFTDASVKHAIIITDDMKEMLIDIAWPLVESGMGSAAQMIQRGQITADQIIDYIEKSGRFDSQIVPIKNKEE